MARWDVYRNPGAQAATTPYLLDVQSDLLDALDTRIVIPLRSLAHFPAMPLPTRLTPVFRIGGADYMLETPKMAAVPARILRGPVASLSTEHLAITGALDFLFQGF